MNDDLFRSYLRNVTFQSMNSGKNFSFDLNQDGLVRYDVTRYAAATSSWHLIGEFNEDKQLGVEFKFDRVVMIFFLFHVFWFTLLSDQFAVESADQTFHLLD